MPTQKVIQQEGFLFSGQPLSDVQSRNEQIDLDTWKIVVVDDEPEIHQVTKMALSGTKIAGKHLSLMHAYSAEEALALLKAEENVAVVILDVVMESDDAGLKLVKSIRDDLRLLDVRIILRTGQPGYAPEEKVISEFEINDYIMKTETTRSKLFSSLYTAIRSYQQLCLISEAKDFLQRLTIMNSSLIEQKNFAMFVRCLVHNSLSLFKSGGPGVFLLNKSKKAKDRARYRIEYSTEEIYSFKGHDYEEVLPQQIATKLKQAILSESSFTVGNDLILFIPSKSCSGILILFDAYPNIVRPELIQSFTSNIASDLDNALLLKQISNIAYLDSLTNLPNRTKFIEALDKVGDLGKDGEAISLVDIEHFSDINDGLGQDSGNLLLQAVAERLCSQLDKKVTVYRVAADVFGLIGSIKSLEPEKILAAFDLPFLAGEHLIPVNARIGITKNPSLHTNGLDIIKQTNIALNRAKKDAQSRVNFYVAEMEDETAWRLEMIRKLTDDFYDQKLQVWYQPQLDLKNNKIIGAEALLRWPTGNGSFHSPLTFIPLAEYTGLIVDIGSWVLEQACIQVNQMKAQGFTDHRIAVNVSMPQFKNAMFVDTVVSLTNKYHVDPKNIELEITESVVMDDTTIVITALEKLRRLGYTVAIDDFGTGFSSLSYLHKLPINRLKVDREFIKDIGFGGDGILAETIINLGQKLGLEVIAEGIETEEQQEFIKRLGCHESQGYYHAKPMPAEELEVFLREFGSKQN
ncbi:EAL domain-containing protein [Psychrosphaera sp.]|nr:EAL domain-containing protein [Psychrosphaera sp.]